jgi:hypothetical protein
MLALQVEPKLINCLLGVFDKPINLSLKLGIADAEIRHFMPSARMLKDAITAHILLVRVSHEFDLLSWMLGAAHFLSFWNVSKNRVTIGKVFKLDGVG